MKFARVILSAVMFIICHDIYALPVANKWKVSRKDWNFIENKGQVADNQVRYYGHQGGIYLYCKPGMISFVFTKTEKESEQISEATCQPIETQCPSVSRTGLRLNRRPHPQDAFNAFLQKKISTCRADMVLLNANPNAEIIPSARQEYYENYYTASSENDGITHVNSYKTITYKNIYPNIDLVLHSREEGMKYEFVVYPNGNVGDIQIQWNGLEPKKFPSARPGKDLAIEYSCSLGSLTESAPYSYQYASLVRAGLAPAQSANLFDALGTRKGRLRPDEPFGRAYMDNSLSKIPSHFILKNNLISFKTGKYDKTKTLVIDPILDWGTYFGGYSTDESQCIAPIAPKGCLIGTICCNTGVA